MVARILPATITITGLSPLHAKETSMKEDIKIDPHSDKPLREVVFLRLRQAILRGELQPGDRLMEISLASQLGVSRTPVRDALHKLEKEGLVNMVPRCGAEVANITDKDMRDVLEVRTTLEELAVELCIERINDDGIKRLKAANKTFKEKVEEGELLLIAEADVAFHDIIYSITENRRLLEIISELRENLYRYRLEYLKNESARLVLVKEHDNIIKFITEKNTDKCKKAIRSHIENQMNDIAAAIKAG